MLVKKENNFVSQNHTTQTRDRNVRVYKPKKLYRQNTSIVENITKEEVKRNWGVSLV